MPAGSSSLLKRVFDYDVEGCVCGGTLKIIAAIEEPGACRTLFRQAPQAKLPVRIFGKRRQETVEKSLLRADEAKRVEPLDIILEKCGGFAISSRSDLKSERLLAVIERILTHLWLCAQPPPGAPAPRFDLFQAA